MLEYGPKKFVILGHFLLLHMPEENKVVELYRKIDIRRNPQSSWRERKKKVDFHIFATVIWKDFKTPNTVVACQEITKIFIGRYFKVPRWLLSNKASNAKTSNNIFCRRHEDMKPMPKIGFLSDFCHGQPKKI